MDRMKGSNVLPSLFLSAGLRGLRATGLTRRHKDTKESLLGAFVAWCENRCCSMAVEGLQQAQGKTPGEGGGEIWKVGKFVVPGLEALN
jgi:hypothetical protein